MSTSSTIPMDPNISKKKFAYIQKNNTTEKQGQNYFFSQYQSYKNQSNQNPNNFKIKNQKQRSIAFISQNNQISSQGTNINKSIQKRNNENCGLLFNSSHRQGYDYQNNTQEKKQLKDLYLIIEQLSRQLQKQKNKFKQFQEKTIRDQMNVLNSLNFLQQKLKKLSQQKKDLIKQVQLLKQEQIKFEISPKNQDDYSINIISLLKNKQNSFNTDQKSDIKNIDIDEILNKLTFQLCQNCLSKSKVSLQQIFYLFHNKQKQLKQFKQIKGISNSLIDMMYKVEGIQKCSTTVYEKQKDERKKNNSGVFVKQPKILKNTQKLNNFMLQKQNNLNQNFQLKEAWKWIKKIVHEYQMIKKKAFKWKKIYDEVIKGDYSSNNSQENLQSSSERKHEENIRKQNQPYSSNKLGLQFDSFMNINSSEDQSQN